MRPDEALKILAVFEGKLARLKEERDNLTKAKEALELAEPGIIDVLFYFIVGVLFFDEVLLRCCFGAIGRAHTHTRRFYGLLLGKPGKVSWLVKSPVTIPTIIINA